MKKDDTVQKSSFLNYFILTEIFLILLLSAIYLTLRKNQNTPITGDVASLIFYFIVLVILVLGIKNVSGLSMINEQSVPYYLVANVLALLYTVVAILSKIALFIDQWLNGEPQGLLSLVYPVDVFLLIGILMSVFLPFLYSQIKKQVGVK